MRSAEKAEDIMLALYVVGLLLAALFGFLGEVALALAILVVGCVAALIVLCAQTTLDQQHSCN